MPEIEEVLPKYLQIAGYLRDQIVRGDLPPGAEVPSERELAATWKVARPTASKALQALRHQGLVESRQGSGTFVREPHAAPRTRERLERAAKLGTMYSDNESVEFPFVGIVDGPEYVTGALNLPAGGPVIQRQRIISSETSGLVELSTSWFPAKLAESAPRLLLTERVGHGTLGYIAKAAGIRAAYARDQVCARPATDEESRALDLASSSAVLVYWLVAYDSNDAAIAFDEAVYPPHRWSFRQEYPLAL
ncbi:GntR family transcriptional regulator [Nocardia sp. CDC159]|uniref:GntR family transcriptional regulator n=1 Tax=Nocardia pulmonis TaxID=2951408 RepID=A0A9X2IX28_9NOCA|nr:MULTISPECIES: GntR family transcriptional regulator [Nocardia]MCM6774953.1 GntR family transcriptional regulator [Nocardia pulmonis]MCM6789884.1 GntR family transcriptional regulator [Nocardia sp. CDC159]